MASTALARGYHHATQLLQRDRCVFQFCHEAGLPVFFVLAGGYQEPIETRRMPYISTRFERRMRCVGGEVVDLPEHRGAPRPGRSPRGRPFIPGPLSRPQTITSSGSKRRGKVNVAAAGDGGRQSFPRHGIFLVAAFSLEDRDYANSPVPRANSAGRFFGQTGLRPATTLGDEKLGH